MHRWRLRLTERPFLLANGAAQAWRTDCLAERRMSALEAGNEAFHQAYSRARDGVRQQVPVLVVLSTELALHHQNRRRGLAYSRPSFAQAKSVAHIAVALFTLTDRESHADRREGVARLREHIAGAVDAAQPAPGAPLDEEIKTLLERCSGFAQLASENDVPDWVRVDFARDAGVRILRITELATDDQIAGLHEAVEAILRTLSVADQQTLQVVVVGDHQARARSLGMQYFKRRFQEEPGRDLRVTYGENIADEQEAISLVATRRLDERIALAFFGDESRLQRDVLGDAAKRCLDQLRFPS